MHNWDNRHKASTAEERTRVVATQLSDLLYANRMGDISTEDCNTRLGLLDDYAKNHSIPFSLEVAKEMMAKDSGEWEESGWDASDSCY